VRRCACWWRWIFRKCGQAYAEPGEDLGKYSDLPCGFACRARPTTDDRRPISRKGQDWQRAIRPWAKPTGGCSERLLLPWMSDSGCWLLAAAGRGRETKESLFPALPPRQPNCLFAYRRGSRLLTCLSSKATGIMGLAEAFPWKCERNLENGYIVT
jgi:hypothetical protein